MAGGIEFVAGPEPAPGEEPSAAGGPPARRRPWLVASIVGVALAAVAIWVASRPTPGDEPASRPVVTVTAGPSSVAPVTGQRVCSAGGRINPQLRRLVARSFPGWAVLTAQSYRCTLRRTVVSESIAMRLHAVTIEVQATRRVGDSGQYLPVPAGRNLTLLASVESQSAGLNVLVSAYGRPRTTFQGQAMSRLASDVSLGLVL